MKLHYFLFFVLPLFGIFFSLTADLGPETLDKPTIELSNDSDGSLLEKFHSYADRLKLIAVENPAAAKLYLTVGFNAVLAFIVFMYQYRNGNEDDIMYYAYWGFHAFAGYSIRLSFGWYRIMMLAIALANEIVCYLLLYGDFNINGAKLMDLSYVIGLLSLHLIIPDLLYYGSLRGLDSIKLGLSYLSFAHGTTSLAADELHVQEKLTSLELHKLLVTLLHEIKLDQLLSKVCQYQDLLKDFTPDQRKELIRETHATRGKIIQNNKKAAQVLERPQELESEAIQLQVLAQLTYALEQS